MVDRADGRAVTLPAVRDWLDRTQYGSAKNRASLAVDLTDFLAAADHVRDYLREMLALDPQRPNEADAALTKLGTIEALLLTEAKGHLDSLAGDWVSLMHHVATLASK